MPTSVCTSTRVSVFVADVTTRPDPRFRPTVRRPVIRGVLELIVPSSPVRDPRLREPLDRPPVEDLGLDVVRRDEALSLIRHRLPSRGSPRPARRGAAITSDPACCPGDYDSEGAVVKAIGTDGDPDGGGW